MRVPIYIAALTSQNVEMAGEIADGVMPIWWSVDRLKRSKTWVERGRANASQRQIVHKAPFWRKTTAIASKGGPR